MYSLAGPVSVTPHSLRRPLPCDYFVVVHVKRCTKNQIDSISTVDSVRRNFSCVFSIKQIRGCKGVNEGQNESDTMYRKFNTSIGVHNKASMRYPTIPFSLCIVYSI